MRKALILVAEDDLDDRFILNNAFQEAGDTEELVFVENGVDLLQFLQGRNDGNYPELILLDLNMPKKNGKETLNELKTHPLYKKIPVIVYTTTRNEAEIKACYEIGANTYIVKPSTFDEVKSVVANIRNYWLSTLKGAMKI
ncbi:MAG TPA: response regulator [Chryseosolibacter sp.]|nr:response regulator [Chryseosolibacter sp.]